MISPNHKELLKVAFAAAEKLPVANRCRLYRGMAEICGDAKEARRLIAMAVQLEIAERLCREFKFSFEQENTGFDSGGKDGGQ